MEEKEDVCPDAPAAENTEGAPAEETAEPKQESNPGKEDQPDEAAQWKDKYLRTLADFDNFRKRTARDREELFKQAAADVIKDVIETVDNLQRALESAHAEDPFAKGVKMVYDSLVKTLSDHGATPLDAVGEPLDPNFHQALAKVPDAKVPEDHIITEVKRGWMLNGKLLRAAQVVVSAGAPGQTAETAETAQSAEKQNG